MSRKSLLLLPHSTPVRESTSKVGKGLYSSFWIQPFRGRVFHPVASRGIPATSAFFSRLIASEVVLLEENALGVLDWAITLRLWNMKRLMFCVGFATAKIKPIFLMPRAL